MHNWEVSCRLIARHVSIPARWLSESASHAAPDSETKAHGRASLVAGKQWLSVFPRSWLAGLKGATTAAAADTRV